MLNIANLLEGLEELIFEVLMWVVFVPKTLLKTLWDPDWVPQYVDEELNKKEGRFSNYISPLLLIILITVGLYGLFDSIGIVGLADVDWPKSVKVGETTIFALQPEFRWNRSCYGCPDNAAVEIWGVSKQETFTVVYRLIRYNSNLTHLINMEKLIEQYGNPDSTKTVVDITSEVPHHSLEFTWLEPGQYPVGVMYVSEQGEINGALHTLNVSGGEVGAAPQTNIDKNDFQDVPGVFDNQERAFTVALAGLILPLWLTLGTELIKRIQLTRTGLQRSLYIHSLRRIRSLKMSTACTRSTPCAVVICLPSFGNRLRLAT